MTSEIQRILVKFLNKEANITELEKLDLWLKNKNNIPFFNHYVKTQYIASMSMSEYDINKAKESIKQKLKNSKRKRRVAVYKRIGIAASILIIVGTSFYVWNSENQVTKILNKAPKVIEIGTDKAILTLENGNQVALEKGKEYQTEKVSSNGEKLVYSSNQVKNSAKEQPIYNYLTVPRGGQFFVQLSDDTEVWMNSESKLKYPVKFLEGQTRIVELVYGEAYFKVSPSTNHNSASFHVLTKSQEVTVLGTEFNIKAYNKEVEIATTLVEGKIKIENGEYSKVLLPSQQSKINIDNDSIEVSDIYVAEEISWINGLFTFNEKPLDDMMVILSRWYDTEVFFESDEQKNFVFTGILERTESIEDILELIEATSEGQVKFKINNKTIIIK